MDNEYLDFDEAVELLKTTPSTLYKWLQSGKIPAHKLGRQWRFLRDELDLHVSGKAPKIQLQKEVLQLTEFLGKRAQKTTKEGPAMNLNNELPEKLIWDAFDHGCNEIHFSPTLGKYEITYRNQRSGYEKITKIEEGVFKIMDDFWVEHSTPIKNEYSRRIYLHRNEDDVLQIRYQKVDTVSGPHLSLSLLQPKLAYFAFEQIGLDEEQSATFKKWTEAQKGLIIVSGPTGSGKTTTVYSLMNEIKKQSRIIFTLENATSLVIDGINQVEYSSRDKEDFEKNFEAINLAGTSVICLGLGLTFGLEKTIYSAAYHAASTGTLVILQMNADSAAEAIEIFEREVGASAKKILVGASWQKLVSQGGKLKAHYEFVGKS
ncbi:ATPase, T2SS/T4P/T4SS family [Bdellovibrio sp. HCB337]|uniref:ATPase, T2SS/T4P/T4SS family n=1 Tax=Bdellovibrio sp. HCB337 TaxID=3394358 RepID=UPI0039A5F97A